MQWYTSSQTGSTIRLHTNVICAQCAIYHEKCYILLRCVRKKQTKKKKNNNRLDFVLPRMIGYGMFGV